MLNNKKKQVLNRTNAIGEKKNCFKCEGSVCFWEAVLVRRVVARTGLSLML